MNREKLIEELENTDESRAITLHNEYREHISDNDSKIYDMSELDDLFHGKSASDLLDSVDDGFNTNHDFFTFNGYGLAVSFDYIHDEKCPLDFGELADWLIEQDHEILEELSE